MNKYFTLKSLLSQQEEPDNQEQGRDNLKPGKAAIRNILSYSKSLRVYSTHYGNLKFNMN
ncbi:MAG: hypothetical protein ACQESX_05250 [Bacteroidota bacterium]